MTNTRTELQDCPDCGGRGRIEDGTEFGQQCQYCSGTGEVFEPHITYSENEAAAPEPEEDLDIDF